MKWIETNPLPAECDMCTQQSCYNCESAGKRWFFSKKDDLLLRRRMLEKTILRAQKQMKEIDTELAQIEKILLH